MSMSGVACEVTLTEDDIKNIVTTVKFKDKWGLGKDLDVTLYSILKEASMHVQRICFDEAF